MSAVSFQGTWQALLRLVEPGGHRTPLIVGVLFLAAFGFMREPSLQELKPIEGTVSSLTPKTDKYGKVSSYEFTLGGYSQVFWSYHKPVDRGDAKANAHVIVYSAFSKGLPEKTLGGTVKTYGLTVNGAMVIDPVTDLESAHLWLDRIFPVLGIIFMGLGIGIWRWREARTASPNKSLERTRER